MLQKLDGEAAVMASHGGMYGVNPEQEGVGVLTPHRLIVTMTGRNGDRWDEFPYAELWLIWDKTFVTLEPRGVSFTFFDKSFCVTLADRVEAVGVASSNFELRSAQTARVWAER